MKKGRSVTFRPWEEQEDWLFSQEDKSEAIRKAIDVYRNLPQIMEEVAEVRIREWEDQLYRLEGKLDQVLTKLDRVPIQGESTNFTYLIDPIPDCQTGVEGKEAFVEAEKDDQQQDVDDAMAYFADSLSEFL